MERVTPRTLSGFMELLPEQQAKMEIMREALRNSYALFGFTPLDTAAIQSAEVLLAKGSGETEKQIYRFMKGDNDLALRFDLTVPLAKYVAANYGKLTFPFRRYQIGKAWRGERAQRGRFREFYQADIDIIGDGSLDSMNDAEIPAVICHSFRSLGLSRFTIRFNNRKVLNGFFAMLGIEGASAGEAMRTIDKIEKIGRDKTLILLINDCNMTETLANELLDFISFEGTTAQKIEMLEGRCGVNTLYDEGVAELRRMTECLPSFGVEATNFMLDLTIARGLDYYTGMVYETIMTDYPEIGSVCSGGRYDNLAEYYTDKKLPGVGISIGLSRLFYVLDEQGLLNEAVQSAPADVLIVPMTEDLPYAAAVATVYRAKGLRTQIYTEQKKFKQKLSYADKLSIPFVVLIGEDEIKSDSVSVKNMVTGEQTLMSAEQSATFISEALEPAYNEKIIREKI